MGLGAARNGELSVEAWRCHIAPSKQKVGRRHQAVVIVGDNVGDTF